jgi:hypothetical protein
MSNKKPRGQKYALKSVPACRENGSKLYLFAFYDLKAILNRTLDQFSKPGLRIFVKGMK